MNKRRERRLLAMFTHIEDAYIISSELRDEMTEAQARSWDRKLHTALDELHTATPILIAAITDRIKEEGA